MKARGTFEHFLRRVLGLGHLSRAQWVYVRVVFDRVEPGELEGDERELARELFGDVDTIPDAARHVVCTLKGARVGGTWLHSLYLLFAALTADLSGLAQGEVAFGIIVAPDLRLARQALRYCAGAAKEARQIAQLIVSDGTDSLQLRRPQDGRTVEIACLPASRGGASVRGRTLFAALLDEASFFRDESSVVNASEVYRAVVMRILPGGLLSMVSTVWSETDLLFEKVEQNFGRPQSCLACRAPTLLMRNDERIKQIVAEERERDPQNAAREFDLQPFAAGAGLFFAASTIADARDDGLPLVVSRGNAYVTVGVGCDTGLVNDSSACVSVHLDDKIVTVAEVAELRPTPGAPLRLSEVCTTYAELMQRHGAWSAYADHHELEPSREHLLPHGAHLEAMPGGNAGKFDAYTKVRNLLNEGRLRIPAGQKRLLRQLREVCSRPMPGGSLKIWSPRRGGHGDLVSALVNAVWAATEGTTPLIEAMRIRIRRRELAEQQANQAN